MFIEIPANKKSILQRGVVYGFGINDSDYLTMSTINGVRSYCPFYVKWVDMLKRCYSPEFSYKNPSYIGCYVCDDWGYFSRFKEWMKNQDWQGKHLDKDLLIQGGKLYSPLTCLFVNQEINKLLNKREASRGAYPQGVTFAKTRKKYKAKVNYNGKTVSIGYYDTPELASEAYKAAKYKIIKQVALKQIEPLQSALLSYKIK